MKKILILMSILSCLSVVSCAQEKQEQVFTNPLLPYGADPYSFYKDGYYYYTHTAHFSSLCEQNTILK